MRESGAIEQDADMVSFYIGRNITIRIIICSNRLITVIQEYRIKYIQPQQQKSDDDELEKVEVIIGKHRSGPTGTIILGFRPGYQQFVNVIDDDELARHSQ